MGTTNFQTDECAYEDRGDSHLGKLVYGRRTAASGPEYSREAQTQYRNYDPDGVADQWSKTWFSYDDRDRLISILYEYDDSGRSDGGADGVLDARRLQRSEYDTDGKLVRDTYETVGPDSSSVPFREERLYMYDAHGWRR